MKVAYVIVAVLIAAVLTGISSMTTAYAYISNAAYGGDTSNTDAESNSEQNIVASGINVNVQNCAENNVDSTNTAGDEGMDCHNNQSESQNESASD
jgi:hypothetical protein